MEYNEGMPHSFLGNRTHYEFVYNIKVLQKQRLNLNLAYISG